MKDFRNKMFALALLGIVNDSLAYIESRYDQEEKSFHIEKRKNL